MERDQVSGVRRDDIGHRYAGLAGDAGQLDPRELVRDVRAKQIQLDEYDSLGSSRDVVSGALPDREPADLGGRKPVGRRERVGYAVSAVLDGVDDGRRSERRVKVRWVLRLHLQLRHAAPPYEASPSSSTAVPCRHA